MAQFSVQYVITKVSFQMSADILKQNMLLFISNRLLVIFVIMYVQAEVL